MVRTPGTLALCDGALSFVTERGRCVVTSHVEDLGTFRFRPQGFELSYGGRRLRFVLGRAHQFSPQNLASVVATAGGAYIPMFTIDAIESRRLAELWRETLAALGVDGAATPSTLRGTRR